MEDHIDRLRDEWASALPELDTSSLEIAGRLYRLARWVEASATDVLRKHRLSVGDFSTLVTLRRRNDPEGVQPSALTTECFVTSGATTGRLDRLEASGLVRRKRDGRDRRSVRVHLTAKGRRRAEAAIEEVMASERQLLAALSAAERSRLADLLRATISAVEQTRAVAELPELP